MGCSEVDGDPIDLSLKAMKISIERLVGGGSPDPTHDLRSALPCVLSYIVWY